MKDLRGQGHVLGPCAFRASPERKKGHEHFWRHIHSTLHVGCRFFLLCVANLIIVGVLSTACIQVRFFTSDQPAKYSVQSWAFPDSRNAKLRFLQVGSRYGLCSKCQANSNMRSWRVLIWCWSGQKYLMFYQRILSSITPLYFHQSCDSFLLAINDSWHERH